MRIVYILSSVFLGVLGQLLFKSAVNGKGCDSLYSAALCSLFSIKFWMGLSCYSFSLLLWMYVLSQNDLSYARPFAGLGYIFTAVFASIFFSEQLSPVRLAGIVMISAGVFLVARTG